MSKRGFTLIEMLVVVVTMSLLVAMAFPRVGATFTRTNVRSTRTTLVNYFAKARSAAIVGNREVQLSIQSGVVVLTAGTDTLAVPDTMMRRFGTSVSPGDLRFRLDPRGFLVEGGPATIRVARGSVADSIQITGFGRVIR